MVDHEIIPLPSASVMAVLRRETQQRKAAAKAVAVLADPVFETDDPRLAPEVVARLKAEQAKKAKTKASGTGQPKASSFFLPASPPNRPGVPESIHATLWTAPNPARCGRPARRAQHFTAALQRAGG